ncbi:MAG: hypothetical protein QOJ51_1995 [Acidobacteriaceae bacterium]|nr:hypothetical protein [Acidobacteriaceae bacterium]
MRLLVPRRWKVGPKPPIVLRVKLPRARRQQDVSRAAGQAAIPLSDGQGLLGGGHDLSARYKKTIW